MRLSSFLHHFNTLEKLSVFWAFLSLLLLSLSPALAETAVEIGVLRVNQEHRLPSSRLDIRADDWGIAGAQLGLNDNQTTGNFLGLKFSQKVFDGTQEEVLDALKADHEAGIRLFLISAPAAVLTQAAELYPDALFFNITSRENDLRNNACKANLLHVVPSYSMFADALAQYLMWKKWGKWFLVFGSHEDDKELAESFRKSANKFRATMVGEKEFTDTGGARRTDTGFVQVQQQIPTFMQDAPDHDVVIAADANDVFANYLPYRTWEPRPVAGSAGLKAVTWNAAHEAWGANQFQARFEKLAGRYAQEEDYQFWLGMRIIGEAVVRTKSTEAKAIHDYLLSDKFEIAAFKGTKLHFRNWNGQLRQPILLSDGALTVSVSPQTGYLHQVSELDTMGLDKPESKCTQFGEQQ